jgi:CubicO group peptidase (beta-lactamase class C family)
MLRRALTSMIFTAALAGPVAVQAADPAAVLKDMGAGISAKIACSGVFVAGRPLDKVIADDVLRLSPATKGVEYKLDKAAGTVTASLGGVTRTALYREGFGCTLDSGTTVEALRAQAKGVKAPPPMVQRPGLWPEGDAVEFKRKTPEVDQAALAAALDNAFAEPGPGRHVDTRAVLVVYDGRLVAERYAEGYDQNTRFLGWSASKSIMASLIGTLVTDGKLKLSDPAPVAEWKGPGDPRGAITLDNLMKMSSGLSFAEPYDPGSDSTVMLFSQGDMGGYAASQPLEYRPGTKWYYSSGTSNILSRIVRQTLGVDAAGFQAYARERLFGPAGMTSAVFEPDASGDPVGSSYFYATGRDWARFGLLYMNRGVIGGRTVLSPSFVDYVQQPTSADPTAGYGGQFWLNGLKKTSSGERLFPDLPADTYLAQGHNNQHVAIIASRRLVIVRLGWTEDAVGYDVNARFGPIVKAFGPPAR